MNDILTMLLMTAGVLFFLAGSLGLLRFPDVYSRLHALTKADNLGLGLIAVGAVLQSPGAGFTLRAGLVWLTTLVASAVVSSVIARHTLMNRGAPKGDDGR